MGRLASASLALLASIHVGASPSGSRNKATIQSYFDGVFLSNNFQLSKWLEDTVADEGVFQFCPLTATNLPNNPYPHCTDAKGKKAYLAYVEKDQLEFGSTRISNITYAVTEDGSQVFSRYMVTGSLEGKPVPWFDQVMAWSFNPDGKITKTVFWSDTYYWHKLYEDSSQTPINLMARVSWSSFNAYMLHFFSACLLFVSGIWLGRRFPAKQQYGEMRYLPLS